MSIEQVAPYSPDIVYGQLTSPFKTPKVTINSHVSGEDIKESDATYSRADFQRKTGTSMISLQLGTVNVIFEGIKDKNTPAEITNFCASEMSSNSVLRDSLKNGYSVEQSVVMQNAHNAYYRSSTITDDPSNTLGTCSYRVF